ncbi:hypothetical protein MJO29_016633 [Puccinia striiformis f. sp. tritici]|nr:hypothetical protein MJO29_016633 [Puccinia striiformis f. sp. tritici]
MPTPSTAIPTKSNYSHSIPTTVWYQQHHSFTIDCNPKTNRRPHNQTFHP